MFYILKVDDYLRIFTDEEMKDFVAISKLKKFKVQTILVLGYKKRNDCRVIHSSTKLTATDSDIYKVFKSVH